MDVSLQKLFKNIRVQLNDSLIKNSVYLIANTFVGASAGFIFWLVIAKFYSVQDVGYATALISGINLIAMLSILGLDTGLIRFLSSENEKANLINSCFLVSTLLALIFAILFIHIAKNLSTEFSILFQNNAYALIFVLFAIFMVIITLQANVFLGLREGKYMFLQSSMGSSRLIIVIMLTSWGVLGILFSYGLAILFAFLVGNLLVRKVIDGYRLYPTIRLDLIQRLTSFSLGNYGASIVENLPTYLLPLVILHILGPEDNAYFAIAWAFSVLVMSIPKSAALSLFAEGSNDPSNILENVTKAIKFILAIMTPAFVAVIIFGRELLQIFGEQYSHNAYLLLILFILGGFPYSLNSVFISVKRIRKDIKSIVILHAIIALVYLSTSYLLINEYGLIGSGLSWTVTHSLIALAILLLSRQSSKVG